MTKNECVTLQCDLIVADQLTQSGRIYTKDIMQKIADLHNEKEQQFGKCKDPDSSAYGYNITLDLKKISHEVKNLRINSDNKFEAEIVPKGPERDYLQEFINDENYQLQIFPNIIGTIDENNRVTDVNSVISFDIALKD